MLDLHCQMPGDRSPDWQVIRNCHASTLINSQAAALADALGHDASRAGTLLG